MRHCLAAVVVVLAMAGCKLPRDVEDTLSTVRNGTLAVGISSVSAHEAAAEPAVLRQIADQLDAELKIVPGELHALVEAVATGSIHLVAGGIPKASPFSKSVAFTRPVGWSPLGKTVFGVKKGENAFLLAVNRAIASAQDG